MCSDLLADRVGQTVPQVPPVSDLHGTGQRVTDGLGVGGRAVTAHDLDARMIAQPGGDDLRAPAGQHVDPPPGGRVDQHGRVLAAAPQGEVVDPQHPRHRHDRQRQVAQRAQRGVLRGADPDGIQRAHAGAAGELTHHTPELSRQPGRAPLIPLQQARDLLAKRALLAPGHLAAPTTHPHPDAHRTTIDRNIGHHPLVIRVHPPTRRPASGAGCRAIPRAGGDHDRLTRVLDALDHQRRQPREHRPDQHLHIQHGARSSHTPHRRRTDHRKCDRAVNQTGPLLSTPVG